MVLNWLSHLGITVDQSRVGPLCSLLEDYLHKVRLASLPLMELSCWRIWYRERLGDQSTIYDGLVRDSPAFRSLALQLPYQVEIKSSSLIDVGMTSHTFHCQV